MLEEFMTLSPFNFLFLEKYSVADFASDAAVAEAAAALTLL